MTKKPLNKVKLTPMQRTFVKVAAATGDQTYAATKAGYAEPVVAGSKLMAKAHIKQSVYNEQMRRLEDEGLAVAVDRVIANARDNTKPGGVQNQAAKIIIDTVKDAQQALAANKDLGEMSAAELRALGQEIELARQIVLAASGDVDDAHTIEIQPDQGVFG